MISMLGRNKQQATSSKGRVGPCFLLPAACSCLWRLPFVYQLVAFFRARRVVINGWSMYPTLAPGERVLFDTLAYRLGHPQRGDVVLARHPTRPSIKLVKRIAAVPRDRVTVQSEEWRIEEAPEPGVSSSGAGSATGRVLTLDDDEYFLVGDAPDLSTDARHFGPTKGRDVQGRAWMVYWPPASIRVIGPGNTQQATSNRG
jgi:signal peptidase I